MVVYASNAENLFGFLNLIYEHGNFELIKFFPCVVFYYIRKINNFYRNFLMSPKQQRKLQQHYFDLFELSEEGSDLMIFMRTHFSFVRMISTA